MIGLLATKGMQSASELAAPFDMSQPSISKHIKVLEKAELITRNIKGRTHRFSLNSAPLDEADAWISRHRSFWEGSLNQLSNLVDTIHAGNCSDTDSEC